MKNARQKLLGDEILSGQLPGGCPFWFMRKSGLRQAAVLLSVNCGSMSRSPVAKAPDGVAHFLEHRLFEKRSGDMGERFAALGGDINASTSFTSTQYTLTCSANLKENIELLFELALDWHTSEESIAREREIIASEILLYRDDAEWVGFNTALRSLYGDHSIAREIAGTIEGLQAISAPLLEAWHRAFYNPANMGLFLCGDFDPDEVLQVSARAITRHTVGAATPQTSATGPVALERAQHFAVTLPISNPQIFLPYADVRPYVDGVELLRREVALELLLDIVIGPASAAFEDWYKRGLILGHSFAGEIYAERPYCFCLIFAETPDPQGLAGEVDRIFAQMEESGEWEADLIRAQRKAYGQMVRGFESVENCVSLMQAATSCGAHPSDYIEVCQSVVADDLADGLRHCLRPFSGGRVLINPREQMRVSA